MIPLPRIATSPPFDWSLWRGAAEKGAKLWAKMGISPPKIAIVTPSFNQGSFIEETIYSVIAQGYPNLSYTVVDAGSSDGTIEALRKYDPWIESWTSEPDRGQAHAINKGFARINGDLLAYINSDDLLAPGILWRAALAYQSMGHRSREALLSFAGISLLPERCEYIPAPTSIDVESWLGTDRCLFQQSTFWSNQLMRRIGGMDEGMNFCFDKDFFLRALISGCAYAPIEGEPGAVFRIHDASKTTTIYDVCFRENLLIAERYRGDPRLLKHVRRFKMRLKAERIATEAMREVTIMARIRGLLNAGMSDPTLIATRWYIGAVKRVSRGWR